MPDTSVQPADAERLEQRNHAPRIVERLRAGLGATLGVVVTAQQGVSYTPIVLPSAGAAVAATTPVQTGTVSVFASVTVTVQLQ